MSKFALLIGINYKGTSNELNGCINDVTNMRDVLIKNFGYLAENIVVMTEDQPNNLKPTALNIMNQFGSLIIKAHHKQAKEIWFHYSGHGSYIDDTNGDELDGKDEVIVPLDYEKSGMISDDLLHNYMEYLPVETRFFCLFDCCHSGTILDLKHRYLGGNKHHTENNKSKIKGKVVMISGCKDDQTSADALIGTKWSGAMTAAFLKSMELCEYKTTYYHLLDLMRDYLRENKYDQIPQLSSSNKLTPVSIFCSDKSSEPTIYTKV
uniref:Peptidase C14 caspase domain-containing protein n=1 Tax=viral metagenome TaxID=1070528 RepID=A0A6C0E8Z1_9ZZZZ